MSIPAQGRRSVLFSPPGVKIRRTIETVWLPATGTMIAGHDARRVLLVAVIDQFFGFQIAYAGSLVGLDTAVSVTGSYPNETYFYGPEEVWARCTSGDAHGGSNILIQSVFYD